MTPAPADPLRFVVLRHQIGTASIGPSLRHGPEHLDWMFQDGDALRTWSTQMVNNLSLAVDLEATELPDHRIAYLDKQGDIGNDRGTVSRIACGRLEHTQSKRDSYEADLIWEHASGEPQRGRLTIQRITLESWRLRLERGL